MSTHEGTDSNQLLLARMVSDAIHRPFILRPTFRITKVVIEDTTVSVVCDVFDIHETAREIRFRRRGIRLMGWTDILPNGTFEYNEFTSWDVDFEPYAVVKYGRGESIAEYRDRRDWEAMQYRCGTAKSPMDNADASSDPSMPMHDYWMRG